MKKTSVYLDADAEARLGRLSRDLCLSRAEVIRLALSEYERQCQPARQFHVFGSGAGDGRSIADFTEVELAGLMKGFGED